MQVSNEKDLSNALLGNRDSSLAFLSGRSLKTYIRYIKYPDDG